MTVSERTEIVTTVRDWVEGEVMPVASQLEHADEYPAELVAQMKELGEASGIPNEEILRTLQELGYTRETVLLLHLVPLISVAWADNKVSGPEREMIVEAARLHGVAENTAAYQQLNDWLTNRPSDEFVDQTFRVIADLAGADRLETPLDRRGVPAQVRAAHGRRRSTRDRDRGRAG